MPDGQSAVLENLDVGVNAVTLTLTAPIAVVPQYERPAYVPEDYKWGSSARGTSGGAITWAVVTSGQTYPSGEFTSQAQAISSVFMPTIRAAFSRWDEVGNFTFVESTNPMTADIVVMFDELSGEGSSTIGLAHTYYSAGSVRDSYISFDIGRRYRLNDGTTQTVGTPTSSGTVDFYTLVLHEVGHALGLDHESDFATVMNPSQNSNITDLTADEINGIRYLYGNPAGVGADDWAGSTSTTGAIVIGSSVIGNIETAGDSDWYRLTLTAGTSYRFDMLGAGALADPYLNLRNSSGAIVASDDNSGGGTDASLVYVPTSSGVYYVDARSATATGTGLYGVLVTQSSANTSDDYAGSTATTGTLAVGGSVTGNIEIGDDRDWFRVTLTAGTTYRINLNGNTLADPLLYLRNSTGGVIVSDDDSGAGLDSQLTYTATSTGTYFIDAQGATLTGTGTYTLSITQTTSSGGADDYPATSATTAVVAPGGTFTGTVETNTDRDWIRVTLTAGQRYDITITGAGAGGGTLGDPLFYFRDSSGTYLTGGSGPSGGSSALSYTPTTTGTYYIEAGSSHNAGTGTYTVTVSSPVPADDYLASTATTASLVVGGTQTGNIETTSDRDWIRVTLTAGQRYDITMKGAGAGGGTLASPLFNLRDSSGALITSGATPSGGTSSLSYAATTTGTYYIDAAAYQNAGTGTYTVGVVQQAAADDHPASNATTGVVAVGGTQAGNIETATDRDWFRVTLTAGQRYTINVRTPTTGSGNLASPLALLKDAGGSTVATGSNPSGGSSSLTYTATTTGNYYIEASAYQNAGTGAYTVAVAGVSVAGPIQPGASDDTTSTPLTLAPNGATLTGSITPRGDRDLYRIALVGGVNYYAFYLNGNTLRDPYLRLLDSAGNGITVNDDGGAGLNSLIVYTVPTTGIYYLEATSQTILPGETGSYSIYATTFVQTDDYVGTSLTTGSISVGGSVTGNIELSGDVDWLRITLTAGQAYRFEIGGATSGRGTLTAPVMSLINLATGYVASTPTAPAGVWADGVFTYIPTQTGTYYVQVGASSGNDAGTYTVSVTSVVVDDHAGSAATTSAIAMGGTAYGAIESANDRDWFRVTLQAGQTYTASVGGGTLTAPSVAIYGSDGALAAADPTPDGQMTFTPVTTGVYYIQAAATSAATGTYTLSLAAGDDYTASTATSGLVLIGQTATGSIGAAGDVDWIRVTLTADTLYQFDGRGTGSTGGTLADPAMSLLNSSGTVIRSDNDSGTGTDSRILFTPTSSGTYYLALSSTSATATGTYTVAATANPDDYAASTATTGSVTVGGSATGLVETAGNRDWFRTTLAAGTTYTVRLTGTATGSALRWTDSSIILRDANGTQVNAATRSGLGASATLTFTAASSGTYYLDALAYGSGVGSYSLSIATGSAQTAAAEDTGLSEADLAALTAPPAIALDEPPVQMARSITVLAEDPLSAILAPPPADLFLLATEQRPPFLAAPPLDQLFQQQPSNSYNLLPF